MDTHVYGALHLGITEIFVSCGFKGEGKNLSSKEIQNKILGAKFHLIDSDCF